MLCKSSHVPHMCFNWQFVRKLLPASFNLILAIFSFFFFFFEGDHNKIVSGSHFLFTLGIFMRFWVLCLQSRILLCLLLPPFALFLISSSLFVCVCVCMTCLLVCMYARLHMLKCMYVNMRVRDCIYPCVCVCARACTVPARIPLLTSVDGVLFLST